MFMQTTCTSRVAADINSGSCLSYCSSASSDCDVCPAETYFEGYSNNTACNTCESGKTIIDDGTDASEHDEAADCGWYPSPVPTTSPAPTSSYPTVVPTRLPTASPVPTALPSKPPTMAPTSSAPSSLPTVSEVSTTQPARLPSAPLSPSYFSPPHKTPLLSSPSHPTTVMRQRGSTCTHSR